MLCVVVALPSEARPLTAHWKLSRDASAMPFPLFRDSGDTFRLIVSGVGKTAAAAATAWLAAGCSETPAAWLNVGIAGGADFAIGEAVLAHAVRDRASGKSWYPPLVLDPGGTTADVITVDVPERDFAEKAVYEMEAAGFYPTACRFSTAELVHCLKIVSDGPSDDLQTIDAKRVTRLIEARLPRIDALSSELRALLSEHAAYGDAPPGLKQLLAERHFTVNETLQLRRLLERRRALAPGRELPHAEIHTTRRGKDVLRVLRAEVDALPVVLAEASQ